MSHNYFKKLFDFKDTLGTFSSFHLILIDSFLYGMTCTGGKFGLGSIYKINLTGNLFFKNVKWSIVIVNIIIDLVYFNIMLFVYIKVFKFNS